MDTRVKTLILDNLLEIRKLSVKFNSFYTGTISPENIICFLLQFERFEIINIVFQLLKRIDFLDNEKLQALLLSAFNKIPALDRENAVIFPLGSSQDSCSQLSYGLFKNIFDDEKVTLEKHGELSEIESFLTDTKVNLIFIDDNITSGTQLRQFFDELLTTVKSPEMVKAPLSVKAANELRKRKIFLCYAIQLTEVCEMVIQDIRRDYNLDLILFAGKYDFNNYAKYSTGFLERSEEELLYEYLINYAENLFADKSWAIEKKKERAIGYGNLGKLTTFYYNVPKSLISIFWKYFSFPNGKRFIPLFPERKEFSRIKRDNATFDVNMKEIAYNLSLANKINRQPNLEIFISPINAAFENSHIVYSKPSREEIYLNVFNDLDLKEIDAEPIPIGKYIPPDLFEEYLIDLNKYNEDLKKYKKILFEFGYMISCRIKFNFIILNNGIGKARNVRLVFHTNSSKCHFFNEIFDFDLPKFKLERPKLSSYNLGWKRNQKESPSIKSWSYLEKISGRPLSQDENFSCSLKFDQISHSDKQEIPFIVILINNELKNEDLRYEVFCDEMIDPVCGNINIICSDMEGTLENEIVQDLQKIQHILKII